jgi:hypothetical protein
VTLRAGATGDTVCLLCFVASATVAPPLTYRYRFVVKPGWLAFLIEPLVERILNRETCRRLDALKKYFEDGRC